MALIAAIPAQAATIYFKNTVGWSTVYVHFYKAACWNNNGTGATRTEHVSVQQMSLISGTDIYSCECTGDYSVVAFTKEEQGNYYDFNNNEVVYRTDFSTSNPLFTPDKSQSTPINNCTYYNVGTWSEYSEPTTNGKIYVPVSEYNVSWDTYIYSFSPEIFGNPGTKMTKETVNGTEYWAVEVESSKLPTTVGGWILHDGKWGNKATGKDLPGVTFQDGYVYYVNGNSEPLQQQLAAPTFSLAEGTYTGAQSVTISATDGATIYYTIDGSDPTSSSTQYEGAITISTTTTLKAIAVKEGYANSEIASATYTIEENPNTGECYFLPNNTADNAQQMTKNADGSFTITVDIAQKSYFGFATKATTEAEYQLGTNAGGDYWYITSSQLDKDITLKLGSTKNFYMEYATGTYTITISADYSKVKLVKSTAQAGDIPVFPLGVNSEAELNAYDFEANPVYYLLADVLNDNRVTPEWQLTKGADGLYHLNGFAMRNTGAVKVRQYTSAGTYVDYASQEFTNLSSEGQLYNATFDPTNNSNSLTLAKASDSKLPFISLVGYMMQQDQVYDTPRGVEKTPEGTKTSKGWQEAWLLYDANGKLLKDRKGNVMYSTMWPPKNPVYFTATISENNQRLYSSDQMTFVPVKDADGNNVGKTGAEWKAELKKLDEEAYKGLTIEDNKTYYRYVVSDIWYVGAGKIWTGWGGETTNSDKGLIANWSKHKNWGYKDKNATDTEGTAIDAQTTYNVVKDKGNFLFNNPTYFKTFEFFYETGDPNANSQIYTTLAYGSASIAAQNVKEGDSYTKGSYQATVTVPEDMTISSWTITRHDATTDALAPISSNNVSDNGVVATYTAEKKDPTSTTFTEDKEGLGEGRYYYELTVTFSNGRTSTVRSNPFVIYYSNQYSVDANGYQLVKLDTAIDGYDYVTYNAKANGDLYFVEFTDNTVSKFRVATSAERESLNGKFANNEGIKWTDKVFVYAPVPAEFKVDAEKAEATVSLDQIVNYDVNATKGVSPVSSHELAWVDNKGNFASQTYKAVMNYKEKDIASTETEKWSDKTSLGKENLTVMQMPNVKGGKATVNVTLNSNSDALTISYKDTEKSAKPAGYYTVRVELPFSDPNVEAANAPQYEVKVTDANDVTTTKVYTASGTGERAITFTNVNPLDFAGKSIEVNAKYSDGTGYNLDANIGEAAKMASGTAAFQANGKPTVSADAFSSYITNNGTKQNVIVVTKMATTYEGGDAITTNPLDVNDCLYNVDFFLAGAAEPTYSQVSALSELNFEGVLVKDETTGHNVWSKSIQFNNPGDPNPAFKAVLTPFYVAKVTNAEGAEGLNPSEDENAQTVESYVALIGNPAEYVDPNNGLQTGVTDITESANVKAYKVIENGEIYIIYGDRKFNVMGAEVK